MESFPASLDHVILGCSDLERGIAFVEEGTGVRGVFGGSHPGAGTQNALLALEEKRYLEIIAPDPKQEVAPWIPGLREMREPRLTGWAARTDDIASRAKKVSSAGVAIIGPYDGSRLRPDGRTLRWKTFRLEDNPGRLLPFFIEWSKESVHPSLDAPAGCRLLQFRALHPDPAMFEGILRRLDVDLAVERGGEPQLRARVTGPRGEIVLSS